MKFTFIIIGLTFVSGCALRNHTHRHHVAFTHNMMLQGAELQELDKRIKKLESDDKEIK